jgi:hypothetical protein
MKGDQEMNAGEESEQLKALDEMGETLDGLRENLDELSESMDAEFERDSARLKHLGELAKLYPCEEVAEQVEIVRRRFLARAKVVKEQFGRIRQAADDVKAKLSPTDAKETER